MFIKYQSRIFIKSFLHHSKENSFCEISNPSGQAEQPILVSPSSQYESPAVCPFTANMNTLKGWERIFGSCAMLMRIAVILAGPCECVCELCVYGLTHLPVICIEEWANWTWVLVVLNCRRQLVHCWMPQWLHCSEGNALLCASPVAHRPVKTHLGLWQQGARNAIRKRQQKGGLRRKRRWQNGGGRGGDNSDMGWSARVWFLCKRG